MSNLCRNTVEISGTHEPINNFKNVAIQCNGQNGSEADIEFLIDALYPCPLSDLKDQRKWRKENWGTCIVYPDVEIFENSRNKLFLKLYSEITPPLRVFEKISKDFPDLLFDVDYWGLGSGFCGACSYKNGEMLNSEFFEDDEYDAQFPVQKKLGNDTPDSDDIAGEDNIQNYPDFAKCFVKA